MHNDDIIYIEDIGEFTRFYYNGEPTNYFVNPINKGVFSNKSKKILKPTIDRNGYVTYTLYVHGHQLVKTYNNLIGCVFLPNDDPENKTDVDHIYGNKLDNDYRKLEWVTHGENNKRARAMGLNPGLCGERNSMCKYTIEVLGECSHLLKIGKSITEVSNLTGVHKSTLYRLVKGKRPDITKDIVYPETIYSHPQKNSRATKEIIDSVMKLRQDGFTAPQISEKLNIETQTVYNIFYYKR